MNAIYNHLHTSTNTTEHFRNLEELLCRRHQVIQTRSAISVDEKVRVSLRSRVLEVARKHDRTTLLFCLLATKLVA